jgi:hypothetical protein
MKNSITLASLFLALLFTTSCSSDTNTNKVKAEDNTVQAEVSNVESDEIYVYYFHATRRCATCQAVEKVSSEFIQNNYADQVEFKSINREEDMNPLVDEYNISSQTLLVVKGSKVVDLTANAFMNARSKPESLTEKLAVTIDEML